MKLIVGLGNPGANYANTRHNVGFLLVDRIARLHGVEVQVRRCDALVGEWLEEGEKIVLSKPLTFMNRSGIAVRNLLRDYGARVQDLLVVYDDLDLPLGRIRIRTHGGAAGHRGLLSILEQLEEPSFLRLRIGIGRPAPGVDAADYVLSPFDAQEAADLERVLARAVEAVQCIVREGSKRAMELYNRADSVASTL